MNDLEISIFFIGALIVRVFGKWLKRVIKQERPIPSNSYGMPSGRGVIVGYTLVYFLLIYPNMQNRTILTITLSSLFACYMKYYLREHSVEQLIAGFITGSILGLLAYGISRYLNKKI